MRALTAMTVAAALAAGPLVARADDAHTKPTAANQAVPAAKTIGLVKKVDKEAGKVTIQHGPLENLNMPAMTMVFRVREPAMLDRLKAGDSIRFVADRTGGQFTVVDFEPSK